MAGFLPGGRFLPPTWINGQAGVGFQAGSNTWIANGDSFVEAYHGLHELVVG